MANIFPIDFEEKLTMAQDDYILFSDSEDGNKIKKAQYKNLKGEKGDPGVNGTDGADGAAATITVGTTTTGAAGTSASVTNSGTSSAAVFNFTIPQGAKGETGADGKDGTDGKDGADGTSATITVGTTTTLPAGSSATVTNSGTSSAAVLNFGIPKGDAGTGSGDVNGPASSTDGDVALFDGATGKIIKDSGVSLSDYQEKLTAGTNIQISASNVISATGGSDIEYVTQAEYTALLPGALTDNKHYFIYSTSGGGGGWQPGANTLLYVPMDTDLLDHSGKSVTVTNNGVSISSGTGYFNGNGYLSIPTADNILGNVFTISWYGKVSSRPYYCAIFGTENTPYGGLTVQYEGRGLFASTILNSWDLVNNANAFTRNLNVWENFVVVRDDTNWSLYKDGTQIWSGTSGSGNIIQNGSASFIGRNGGDSQANITGYLSQFIIENKARTAQEVSDYFNLTKGDYGIS